VFQRITFLGENLLGATSYERRFVDLNIAKEKANLPLIARYAFICVLWFIKYTRVELVVLRGCLRKSAFVLLAPEVVEDTLLNLFGSGHKAGRLFVQPPGRLR
jgi:hypothetical protein